ncbi:MAG: hypothetical protein Q9169_007592 [Polycauliona sp. 2 TL-2023]
MDRHTIAELMLLMVRYNGRYWHFLYHSTGNDQVESLVSTIPTEPEKYQTWLNTMRSRFAKWDRALPAILQSTPGKLASDRYGLSVLTTLRQAFDINLSSVPTYDNKPDQFSPPAVYTIDLDLEVFSVHNEAHYQLGGIPRSRQWIRGLCLDVVGCYFVEPGRVPQASLANLFLPSPQLSNKDTDYWNHLTTRQVVPILTSESLVTYQIRRKLYKLFQQSQGDVLSVSLPSWTAKDFHFRELAYFIICLAFGGEYLTIIDMCRTYKGRATDLCRVIRGAAADVGEEFISSVGSGLHLEDHDMGTAPQSSKYWFEGVLICLVPHLDRQGVAANAIADAVLYAADHGRAGVNVVLISIAGLVLVRTFSDGRVEHSPVMPLMAVQGYRAMDATQRYGALFLEGFADMELTASDNVAPGGKDVPRIAEKGMSKKDVRTRDPAKKSFWNSDEELDEDCPTFDEYGCRKAKYESEGPEEAWDIESTFSRLVQFFDLSVRDTFLPNGPNAQGLPNEVVAMILSYVTDMKTYNACAKVSRVFRDICASRALIMDDVVFFDSPPKGWVDEEEEEEPQDDDDDDEEDLSDFCVDEYRFREALRKEKEIQEFWGTATVDRLAKEPWFYVLEESTGHRAKVKVGKGMRRDKKSAFEMVTGAERNRKSFCIDCPLSILGLNLPTQSRRNMLHDSENELGENYFFFQPDFNGWDCLDRNYRSDWSIEDLCGLYKDEFDLIGCNCNNHVAWLMPLLDESPWLMPPNTRQFFWAAPGGPIDEAHLMYLRIKGASRFVDVSWDEMIKEAQESILSLNRVLADHASGTTFDIVKQLAQLQVRQASLGVILAIGL